MRSVRARRTAVAGLIALLLGTTAGGARASVLAYRADPPVHYAVYLAGAGESNRALLTIAPTGEAVAVEDSGATVRGSAGCVAARGAGICATPAGTAGYIHAELGDGADDVRVVDGPLVFLPDLPPPAAEYARPLLSLAYVFGEGGSDRLRGGVGTEQLSGGAGADRLSGGPGQDDLWGDDVAFSTGGDGDDVIDSRDGLADLGVHCGGGVDTVRADPADPVDRDCERVSR